MYLFVTLCKLESGRIFCNVIIGGKGCRQEWVKGEGVISLNARNGSSSDLL